MWVLKGQPAVVHTQRARRRKMIVYGGYSPQNLHLSVEEVSEESSEVTASFLISLRARLPHRRLDIVLDNAPWHYGKDVRRIARRYKLHLHFLPPYSPDLNAIELLWHWARSEKTYNYEYPSFPVKRHTLLPFFDSVRSRTDELKRRLVPTFRSSSGG